MLTRHVVSDESRMDNVLSQLLRELVSTWINDKRLSPIRSLFLSLSLVGLVRNFSLGVIKLITAVSGFDEY